VRQCLPGGELHQQGADLGRRSKNEEAVLSDYANWTTHPNNPNAVREAAEEAQSRKLANCLIHDRISRRITVNNSHPSLAAGIFKCRELACQE
jgi:two-component sensor histidine kinase